VNWLASLWQHWPDDVRAALRVALILLIAWLAVRLAARLMRAFRKLLDRRVVEEEDRKRMDTLYRVSRYTVTAAIWAIAASLVLSALGISIAPILGAAGVVGIAVGFGAQSLAKDFFSGFFMLFENQLRRGDVVTIAGIGGLVEEVTLRYVRLRDYDGNVHYIPNGEITVVTNRSRDFSMAVMDVGVAYRESVDEVLKVMAEVGAEMRSSADFGWRILEDLEIAGVEKWDDSAVILRCRFKAVPLQQWNVRREFLRRLKNAFDARGIEIPYPHLTVYAGQDKDGRAPAFRVSREPAEKS
jgi:small conductance mechanosensitive channel